MNRIHAQSLTTERDNCPALPSRRNAVSVYQIRANQRADEPDALFYHVYGGAMQF